MNVTQATAPRFPLALRDFSALFAGLLFSVGLAVGGMTQPGKIVGFLDLFGGWDPALLGVMGGAVAINAVLFPLTTKKLRQPLFEPRFGIPTRRDIDLKLVLGAALFGVGWAMAGLCPGPGIAALATGDPTVVVFVGFMALGMLLEKGITSRLFGSR
jgi:uncharacterized membrane protein YedE/YeeE